MSLSNLNRGSPVASNAPGAVQPESMDAIRKRARHRLIGAAVLVLVGVVGFPLLFDAQPRPVAVDIPIEIPGKNTVTPLTLPAKPEAVASISAKPANKAAGVESFDKADKADKTSRADNVAVAASLSSQEEIIADKKPVAPVLSNQTAIKKEADKAARSETKTPAKPDSAVEIRPEAKPDAKLDSKPTPKADDGARAKALLDGQGSARIWH